MKTKVDKTVLTGVAIMAVIVSSVAFVILEQIYKNTMPKVRKAEQAAPSAAGETVAEAESVKIAGSNRYTPTNALPTDSEIAENTAYRLDRQQAVEEMLAERKKKAAMVRAQVQISRMEAPAPLKISSKK